MNSSFITSRPGHTGIFGRLTPVIASLSNGAMFRQWSVNVIFSCCSLSNVLSDTVCRHCSIILTFPDAC